MPFTRKNRNKKQGSVIIRYLAVIIGICYLANPLQSHISTVFHEISHLFETSHNQLTKNHHNVTSYGHTSNHVQKNSHGGADHANSHSHLQEHGHEHELIDLFNSIFNDFQEGEQEKSVLAPFKLDKHLTAREYHLKKITPRTKKPIFFHNQNNIAKGHYSVLKEPPQRFSF